MLPLGFFPQLQRLVLDELSRDERGRRRPLTPELPTRRGSPWRVQCTLGTDGQIETLDARKLGVALAFRKRGEGVGLQVMAGDEAYEDCEGSFLATRSKTPSWRSALEAVCAGRDRY